MNHKLLLQNEYLIAENRILRARLPLRVRLTDPQRSTLPEIGRRLGRNPLADVAMVAKPETILTTGVFCNPLVERNGKRIPGLKLDHPRQLALMHALVRFANIAVGLSFQTADLHGPVLMRCAAESPCR